MNSTIVQRKEGVFAKLIEIFKILSTCPRLPYYENGEVNIMFSGNPLLKITGSEIVTPAENISDTVLLQKSSLPDSFVSMGDLQKFVDWLNSGIKQIDHIGFCYTVDSQEKELERIKEAVHGANLYEMTSNDQAKWYFVGDASDWRDPMIELLPALPNNASDVPYWMPHIHVDILTSYSADEIVGKIEEIFGNWFVPLRYTDPEWGTHCVRLWLGTIAGININLDISTKVRNLKWVRAHMLQKIV